MKEIDVALTDYLIAVEAAVFAWVIFHTSGISTSLRTPFVWFFAATAAAALAGGTVHGFFESPRSFASVALWRSTLLALGVVAFATWAIGARLMLSAETARYVEIAAALLAVAYAIVVLVVDDRFGVAIAHYLPPTLFLLFAFAWVASQRPDNRLSMLTGVAGLVLTFIAAFVQQRSVALHPAYFNHNATYHAMQAVALFLIFWAARSV
jgi:hypothetical protein